MSIDVLYRVKIDLEDRINRITNEETKTRILTEIAEAQGYTHADITRVPISECRVRQGWIVHRSRVRSKAHARAFRDYLIAKLTQIGAPSSEIVLVWAGWNDRKNAGLPIFKERYTVTDPQTGETTTVTRRRKLEDGTDEDIEFPLDSDLQTFFLQPERTITVDGQDIILPAVTDVNRINDTPRAFSEA